MPLIMFFKIKILRRSFPRVEPIDNFG